MKDRCSSIQYGVFDTNSTTRVVAYSACGFTGTADGFALRFVGAFAEREVM